METKENSTEAPSPYTPLESPWPPPREISNEEFDRYQRRMKREDLRYEAELPDAAVSWWKFRNKVLDGAAWTHATPSGHAGWDHAFALARRRVESRGERDTGLILCLTGTYGAGKTVLATGLMLLVTGKLQSALYTTLFDLGLKLEAALHSSGDSNRMQVIEEYRHPRLLVIDDCSASAASESESRFLRGILDQRYYKKRDTILITNDSPEGFGDYVGGANLSRMEQGGGIIACNWECFRK